MSSVPERDMIDIDSKAKEASAYYSHGLLKESLDLYEQILSATPDLDPKQQELFEEKILLLKKEIEDLEKMDDAVVRVYDISGSLLMVREYENIPPRFETQLDLSGFSSGIYHLQVKTSSALMHRILIKE